MPIPLNRKRKATLSLTDIHAETRQIISKRKAMFDQLLKDAADG